MKPINLKTRYMLGISCLVLLLSFSFLTYGYFRSGQLVEEELHRRGISIARNISYSVTRPIITENRIELQLLLADTLNKEDNLRYIIVLNTHGVPLAHTFGSAFPRELLEISRYPVSNKKPSVTPVIFNGERVANIAVPVQDSAMGSLYIGLSEENINSELAGIALNGLPMAAALLFIGIAAAWWYAARITEPITELVQRLKVVGEGDFTVHIPVDRNDEIGELSDAFNMMLSRLSQMTTEQMKAEDELRLQAEMLEDEVAERQMAQEDLAVKQQQLEILNHVLEQRISDAVDELRLKDKVMMMQGRQAAMGEMINNIAHQWRQPINNLGLLVQGIKADFDNDLLTAAELDETVSKAMNTILFMSQTINDFSSFFSPDRAKTNFFISQGLKKVIAILEATLSSKGITVSVEKENDVMVSGYYNEYNQVLLNLINNAKDVLQERKIANPTIKITISSQQGNAVVGVWDNGGGIDEIIIKQIFDPYFTTKEAGKGSGVGLYMSKMIVMEHFAGTLTAANRDGGAEFVITTPSVQEEV